MTDEMKNQNHDEETNMVYDGESRKVVKIDDETYHEAKLLDTAIERADMIKCIAVALTCQNKRYLALGYNTQEDYFARRLGIGRIQGQKLKMIGDHFVEIFGFENFSVGNGQLLLGDRASEDISKNVQSTEHFKKVSNLFSQLGIEKIAEFIRADIDIKETADEQSVKLPDGTEMPLSDVITMKVTEFTIKIEKEKRQKDKDIARWKERAKLAEAESKTKDKFLEEAKQEIQKNFDEKIRVDGKANKLSEKRRALDRARHHMSQGLRFFEASNIEESDPVELKKEFCDALMFHQAMITHMADRYVQTTYNLEDVQKLVHMDSDRVNELIQKIKKREEEDKNRDNQDDEK